MRFLFLLCVRVIMKIRTVLLQPQSFALRLYIEGDDTDGNESIHTISMSSESPSREYKKTTWFYP